MPPPGGILVCKTDEGVEDIAAPKSEPSHAKPQPPKDTPGPSLKPGHEDPKGISPKSGSSSVSFMAIFSCLVGVTHPDYHTIDEEALDDHLREVEDFLLSQTRFSDQRAYTACPEATRDLLYKHLDREGAELAQRKDSDRERQHNYETRLAIFNAADLVFNFFFPPRVDVPTIGKFWGALTAVITVSPLG